MCGKLEGRLYFSKLEYCVNELKAQSINNEIMLPRTALKSIIEKSVEFSKCVSDFLINNNKRLMIVEASKCCSFLDKNRTKYVFVVVVSSVECFDCITYSINQSLHLDLDPLGQYLFLHDHVPMDHHHFHHLLVVS